MVESADIPVVKQNARSAPSSLAKSLHTRDYIVRAQSELLHTLGYKHSRQAGYKIENVSTMKCAVTSNFLRDRRFGFPYLSRTSRVGLPLRV
jgi:hypothetical protein